MTREKPWLYPYQQVLCCEGILKKRFSDLRGRWRCVFGRNFGSSDSENASAATESVGEDRNVRLGVGRTRDKSMLSN